MDNKRKMWIDVKSGHDKSKFNGIYGDSFFEDGGVTQRRGHRVDTQTNTNKG